MSRRMRWSVSAAILVALAIQVGSVVAAVSPASIPVAFTRSFNVELMNASGAGVRLVTTRGTGYGVNGITYPYYSWSPDGNYMLLTRQLGSNHGWDLLLLNRRGVVIRTLTHTPGLGDFPPTWALDGDQIIYTGQETPKKQALYNGVYSIDVKGNKQFRWGYYSHEGCGGGTADPAEARWWGETGFGFELTMQWSIARHLAVYTRSCIGGLNVTDIRTRKTQPLGPASANHLYSSWTEGVLSPSGVLAVTAGRVAGPGPAASQILLVNPLRNRVIKTVGTGELPRWGPSGRWLYFVRRTPGVILHAVGQFNGPIGFQTYTSAIWRTEADGTHPQQLSADDAFGFGPLIVTPDGGSLIYSQVANDWNIWSHRLTGNRVTAQILQAYGPQVSIQRLDIGSRPVTIARNAGKPEAP